MKILEYLCLVSNRLNNDLDTELISSINQKKWYNKIKVLTFSFILLMGYFAAIYALSCGIEFLILDFSSITLFVSFKLSYIEFKRQGKKQSKKKIFRLMNQDLWDRWLYSYIYVIVFFRGFSNGKINSSNISHFLLIALYLLITEVVFKWIKDIVILKAGGSGESGLVMNEIAFEIATYHENVKYHYLKIFNDKNNNKIDEYFPEKTEKIGTKSKSQASAKISYSDLLKSRPSVEKNLCYALTDEDRALLNDNYITKIISYNWSNLCTDNFALGDKYKTIIDSEVLSLIEMEICDYVFLVNWLLFLKNFFNLFYLILLIPLFLVISNKFKEIINDYSRYYLPKFSKSK